MNLKMNILVALLLSIVSFSSFAVDRLSSEDKKELKSEFMEDIREHKVENGGNIDLNMAGPILEEWLQEHYAVREINKEELDKFLKKIRGLVLKNDSLSNQDKEEKILALFDETIEDVSKTPLICRKEGAGCNEWDCCGGLTCSELPQRYKDKNPKAGYRGDACRADSDCLSKSCQGKDSAKTCTAVKKCFKPVKLGSSCFDNPVCGEGNCERYSLYIAGVGECKSQKLKCKKNNECCSNSCVSNRCVESFMCKSCLGGGQTPVRGQKCCEGLYFDKKIKKCIPDVPPIMMPFSTMFNKVIDFIFPSAHATSQTKLNVENIQRRSSIFNAVPIFNIHKNSSFKTCDINFWHDHIIDMKKRRLFDLQIALLAFEYMSLGSGVNDIWKLNDKSIHERTKSIAANLKENREEIHERVITINSHLECFCFYKQGPKERSEDHSIQFEAQCPDLYNKEQEQVAQMADLNTDDPGRIRDASGIKYEQLIVEWLKVNMLFKADMSIDYFKAMITSQSLASWLKTKNWDDKTKAQKISLYDFTIKPTGGKPGKLHPGVAAAFLAGVGVLSVWAGAGILTAAAVSTGAGVLLYGALSAAWIKKKPRITDVVTKSSYKCGKKTFCTDYSRKLYMPYNETCKGHFNSTACVESVLYIKDPESSADDDKGVDFLIDPWIPLGVGASEIIKDSRPYYQTLEKSYDKGLAALKATKPNGKKKGSFLAQPILTTSRVGTFFSGFSTPLNDYMVSPKMKRSIKDHAIKYAINSKFFSAENTGELERFATYAYKLHFIWPKLKTDGKIAYPVPAFRTYINLVNRAIVEIADSSSEGSNSYQFLFSKHTESLARKIDRILKVEKSIAVNKVKLQLDKLKSSQNQETFGKGAKSILDDNASSGANINVVGLNGEDVNLQARAAQFNNAVRGLEKFKADANQRLADYNERHGTSPSLQSQNLVNGQSAIARAFFRPVGDAAYKSVANKETKDEKSLISKVREDILEAKEKNLINYKVEIEALDENALDFTIGKKKKKKDDKKKKNKKNKSEVEQQVASKDLKEAVNYVNRHVERFDKEDNDSIFKIITKRYFKNYKKLD